MGKILDMRRTMGTQQDKYIEDGLIFWLDGINKGDDPTAWTDLVYGAKFPYNNTIVLNEDNVDFSSNTRVLNASSDYPAPSTSVGLCTIEVVCEYSGGIVYYSPSSLVFGFLAYRILPNRYLFNLREHSESKIYTFTVVGGSFAYQNGLILERNGSDSWAGGRSYAQLGGRTDTNSLFHGKLYCIRIYTRFLSEEEMKHNFEVDKKRFNIV